MSSSSLSSSLHTDSDWIESENSISPSPYSKNNQTKTQANKITETEPTIPNYLKPEQEKKSSSSLEISSNQSINDEDVIEDDSYTKTHRICEVNHNLEKKLSVALMCYKSVSRPFECKPFDQALLIHGRINTEDSNKSFLSHEKYERNLEQTLKQIAKMKKKIEKGRRKLEKFNKEISLAENERCGLRSKFDELSQELNNIAESKTTEKSKCICTLF